MHAATDLAFYPWWHFGKSLDVFVPLSQSFDCLNRLFYGY